MSSIGGHNSCNRSMQELDHGWIPTSVLPACVPLMGPVGNESLLVSDLVLTSLLNVSSCDGGGESPFQSLESKQRPIAVQIYSVLSVILQW